MNNNHAGNDNWKVLPSTNLLFTLKDPFIKFINVLESTKPKPVTFSLFVPRELLNDYDDY